MVKIRIINVGTNKEGYIREGIEEYTKRLSKVAQVEFVSVPETKLPSSPSDSEIYSALLKDADLISKNILKGSFVFAMCIEGKQLSSIEFSEMISSGMLSFSSFTFIIGGSFGLSDRIKSIADYKLSMSKMTLPHSLAKLVLCEQIYRAFSILGGSKYNK